MAEFFDDAARLDRLMDQVAPKFRRRFIEVVKQLKDASTLSQLEGLLAAGAVEEALVAAELAALQLGNMWGEAFLLTGNNTAKMLGNALEVVVNFDQVNVRALNVMQQNQLRLVREFVAEQRQATRLAITDGIERGVNPREMARAFRGSIGLTAKQQEWVNNFRRELEELDSRAFSRALRDKRFDRTLLRAIKDGKPLTPAQIDKMVGRYQEKWIAYRAEVIARTESLSSVHAGNVEMYNQAVDSGTLDADELKRTWVTAIDGRERKHHAEMNGQVRGVNEPFDSPLGNQGLVPGAFGVPEEDIQCRCRVTTRFTDSAKQRAQAAIPVAL